MTAVSLNNVSWMSVFFPSTKINKMHSRCYSPIHGKIERICSHTLLDDIITYNDIVYIYIKHRIDKSEYVKILPKSNIYH